MASLPAPNSRPALRRIATRPPDDPQHHTPPLLPSVPTAPQTIMLLHFLPLIWLRAKIGIDRLDRILPIRHRKMGQNANRAQTGTTQIHRNPYFPFINPTRIRLVLMKLDRLIRTHTSRRTYKQRKYILATSAVFLDAHADLLCRLHDINKCTKNVGGGNPRRLSFLNYFDSPLQAPLHHDDEYLSDSIILSASPKNCFQHFDCTATMKMEQRVMECLLSGLSYGSCRLL